MYSSTFVLISLASLQNANYPSLPLKHRVILPRTSVSVNTATVYMLNSYVCIIETVDN